MAVAERGPTGAHGFSGCGGNAPGTPDTEAGVVV